MIHCSNTEDTPTVIDAQVCAQMWQTPICTVMLRYALTHTMCIGYLTHTMCIGYLTHYVYCHTPLCLDTHSTVVNMHTCTILCVHGTDRVLGANETQEREGGPERGQVREGSNVGREGAG